MMQTDERMFTPIGAVALTAHQKRAAKALENKLLEAVIQDPEVEHPTNISVFIRDEGGKQYVHLIGKLVDEKERDRVEEIARSSTGTDAIIVNEVVLS
jgi:hypothetical protein